MSVEQEMVEVLDRFATEQVVPYLASAEESTYPSGLIDQMRQIGLFGANIPADFGGAGLPPATIGRITKSLGMSWQPLAGLLGTHFRAALYFQRNGTDAQKSQWLPLMASGEMVFGHAYHEMGEKNLQSFVTKVQNGKVSGVKDWSTNARDADRLIVIARDDQCTRAVIIDPAAAGVSISDELPRPGMLGVSLVRLSLDAVPVSPKDDFVGGADGDVEDFIYANEPGSSLAFAARAVGSAEAVVKACLPLVSTHVHERTNVAQGAIALRVGEVQSLLRSMEATWLAAASADDRARAPHLAKVFCARTLQDVVRRAVELVGGQAYAGDDQTFARHYRDALALLLIDTPNDILLTRVGSSFLDLAAQR